MSESGDSLMQSLLELHNVLVGEDEAIETVEELEKLSLESLQDPGYKWAKKIKCRGCSQLFKPFYFGDKPLNRGVMQDCPHCGEFNSFCPAEVDPGPPEEFVEGRL